MRVTRILDLMVLLLLATVLLMPRPDATVKPSLALDPELRDRVAELQSILVGKPDDADTALELANIYLDGHRPDWALATVGPLARAHPDDFRFQHLRAIAYADRFEGEPAFEAASKALTLCESAPAGMPACDEAVHARLALLRSALESVAGVDMKNKPYLAKERIFRELHPVYVPRPHKPKAKSGTATPTGNVPANPAGATPKETVAPTTQKP
jgi:hypothetical protein